MFSKVSAPGLALLAQSSVTLATQDIALCKALGGGWDVQTGSARLPEARP